MKEVAPKKKILIVSHDKIGTSMAGPGIRYHHMAEELSSDFEVTVAFFDASYLPDRSFEHNYHVEHIDAYHFEEAFAGYDIIIALWLSLRMISFCNTRNVFIVFDLYAPVPVENLAGNIFSGKKVRRDDDFEFTRSLVMYRMFFENGDLFLCSNQRQLNFWLGYVFGSDQIRPSEYVKRPIYDRFIYAPMGIDSKAKLVHTKNVMRNVISGVKDSDKVLLWTGGIWGHFDGKVLMRAMHRLKDKRPDIKLVFFGTQHPNPSIPEMKESLDTRKLAAEYGILGKTVIFKDGWVDYSKRINYLLEADIAVNTHKASIETELAHRTRVLDHILSGLPTIATSGDYFSDEIITAKGVGLVVPANDDLALEQAILKLVEPEELIKARDNLQKIRKSYDWSETLLPLKDFLLDNPTKLPHTPRSHKLKDDKALVLMAKKILPVSVKKIIIKAIRYSN